LEGELVSSFHIELDSSGGGITFRAVEYNSGGERRET